MISEDDIVYCDNHLLTVNKPPGMLTQADRTGDLDLLTWSRGYVEKRFSKRGRAYLGLVHRLDRPASGLVVFARTSKAAARLSAQFRDREVTKRYLALVEGELIGSGTLVSRLRRAGQGVAIASLDDPGSKRAELSWSGVAAYRGSSLVEIELWSGRKHQIRLQMSETGHPIVGDVRYGSTLELDGKNIALHCFHLALDHPTLRNRIGWTASPPSCWRVPQADILRVLRRFDPTRRL